jgi:hypothetical protein
MIEKNPQFAVAIPVVVPATTAIATSNAMKPIVMGASQCKEKFAKFS